MRKSLREMLPLFSLLILAGCGPIYGQAMRPSEGIKEFRITEGTLADLRPGSALLVYGPMAKTEKAYYICKGEDDSEFAAALASAGLFQTELHLERPFANVRPTAERLRGMSAAEVRNALQLKVAPDQILFGTIMEREVTVAPARGVIMTVGYRLEFFDLATHKSTVVEVKAKEPADQTIHAIVEELRRQLKG